MNLAQALRFHVKVITVNSTFYVKRNLSTKNKLQ